MNKGIIRLQKELQQLNDSNNPNVVAVPDPDNIFIWNYCIFNLKDCDYEGGYYHG